MIKCSSIHNNNVILCRFITETIHQLQFYRVSQKTASRFWSTFKLINGLTPKFLQGLYNGQFSICLLHILLFCDFYCFKSGTIFIGTPCKECSTQTWREWRTYLTRLFVVLPCLLLLLLRRVPFTGSALGWATAMGAVLVMVVMVAAGSIRVDMSTLRINLENKNTNLSKILDHQKSWIIKNPGLSEPQSLFIFEEISEQRG